MKRVVIFDQIPEDPNAKKDAWPRAKIDGGQVFYSSAVEAIVKHGTYDKYYFLTRNDVPEFSVLHSLKDAFESGRISELGITDLSSIEEHDDAVLMTPTERPARLLALRRFLKKPEFPVVGHLHASDPGWLLPCLIEFLVAGVDGADAFVCSTSAGKRSVQALLDAVAAAASTGAFLQGWEPFQLPVIPLGIDCDAFEPSEQSRATIRQSLGIPNHAPVILYFGRFEFYGKCDLLPLLRAFSHISRDLPEAVLLLAGSDSVNDLSRSLRDQAREVGCEQSLRIVIDPCNEQKRALYGAADVFVSPADGVKETFGITIVEAMASGLPVVASDWDGYRDLVCNAKTGFLIPTAWPSLDGFEEVCGSFRISPVRTLATCTSVDMEALIHSLSALIRNPILRRRMGTAAKQTARQQYHWPVVVGQYENLWQHLVCLRAGIANQCGVAPALTHQQVFAHYPSQWITDEYEIKANSDTEAWIRDQIPLGVRQEDYPFLRADLLARIAEVVVRRGRLRLADLSEELRLAYQVSAAEVRLHASRLLKYGVISMGSAAGVTSRPLSKGVGAL